MSEKELVFTCPISKNRIEFRLEEETKSVYCEHNFIDEPMFKAYFVLLRGAIDTVLQKGYINFVQMVLIDEYKEYLEEDDRWEIIDKNIMLNTLLIQCKLTDAIECICRGLGFKK